MVKPLERILLDNGIIREQLNRRPAATAEAMDVDGSDSDQGNVVEVTSAPSSSSSSSSRKGTNASRSSSAHNPAPSRGQPRSASAVEVKYHTIAAKASVFPARQCFCSVCGYIGHYSCTRCGSKFCSIKCNESHKETRCFKFSM